MRLYLAGELSRERFMRLYIAGEHSVKNGSLIDCHGGKIFRLETYFYARKNDHFPKVLEKSEDLILDSGAFTFMNSGKKVHWEKYVDEYCEFVNHYGIDYFIELDIDSVIGLPAVEKLRKRLEKKTARQCIPVWHRSRGVEYFKQLTRDYNYIAMGASGSNSAQWTRKPGGLEVINKLCQIASKNGCKVHGLGYTNLKGLEKVRFYSVDSTSWLFGNRAGFLVQFNGRTIVKHIKPPNTRMKSIETATHNFSEWIKFQKYLHEKRG